MQTRTKKQAKDTNKPNGKSLKVVRNIYGHHQYYLLQLYFNFSILEPEELMALFYLLTRQKGWVFVVKDFCNKLGIGKDKGYALLKELRLKGFLSKKSHKDKLGNFKGYEFTVIELPSIYLEGLKHCLKPSVKVSETTETAAEVESPIDDLVNDYVEGLLRDEFKEQVLLN